MKKYLNNDLSDLCDCMINQVNPFITKTFAELSRSIKVQIID